MKKAVIYDFFLIQSFIDIFHVNDEFRLENTICRFIIRDFCGKYCWDCCALSDLHKENFKMHILGYILDTCKICKEIINK